MRLKSVLAVMLVLMFALAVPARAEGVPLTIKDMHLSVMPEYDSTDVFVIYDMNLAAQTDFTGDVVFKLPQGARIKQACNVVSENGKDNHLCQLYKTYDRGDYTELRWTAQDGIKAGETYRAYVEFYYNPIVADGASKKVEFNYLPAYAVDSLNLNVAQPLRSENYSSEPQPVGTERDSDGFIYHIYKYQNLKESDAVRLSFSYVKADNKPSVKPQENNQTAAGSGSGSAGGSGGAGKSNAMTMGLLLILLAGFGGFLYLALSGKGKGPAPSGGRRGQDEKRRARQMLLDGRISEETYREIIRDLEREGKKR